MKPQKSSLLREVSVVGSFSQGDSLKFAPQQAAASGCHVVELRLDLYSEGALRDLDSVISKIDKPLIITARRQEEGGKFPLAAAERSALLRRFLANAAMVDVEIQSLEEMSEIVTEAKNSGVMVLASTHDFQKTPPLADLEKLMSRATSAGADAIKFASMAESVADVRTLLGLFQTPEHPPISVMGMGKFGKVSRLLFASAGSILNYGYLDAATVPGQWEAGRLARRIRELGE